jgi:hypothetical protein
MTLKIKQSAFEHSFFIRNPEIASSLFAEIENFKKRNCLITEFDSSIKGIRSVCCEQCLKAYILVKARDFDVDEQINEAIDELFTCKTGHEGYYLDKGKLLKFN